MRSKNRTDAKFCDSCGTPFAADASFAAADQRCICHPGVRRAVPNSAPPRRHRCSFIDVVLVSVELAGLTPHARSGAGLSPSSPFRGIRFPPSMNLPPLPLRQKPSASSQTIVGKPCQISYVITADSTLTESGLPRRARNSYSIPRRRKSSRVLRPAMINYRASYRCRSGSVRYGSVAANATNRADHSVDEVS